MQAGVAAPDHIELLLLLLPPLPWPPLPWPPLLLLLLGATAAASSPYTTPPHPALAACVAKAFPLLPLPSACSSTRRPTTPST